jgi:hypothetical protein
MPLSSKTEPFSWPIKVAAQIADINDIKIEEGLMGFLLKRVSATIVLFTLWLVISELW